MYIHTRAWLTLVSLTLPAVTGCATLFRSGNGLKISELEDGKKVNKFALNLDHATQDLQVFDNGKAIPIVYVKDKIWSDAVKNVFRETAAEKSACVGCTYQWTETRHLGPGLFLAPRRPHTLRFARGGQEASVTVKASFRYKWVIFDGMLGPLCWLAWGVDAMTASWKQFHRLDVDRVFREHAMVSQTQR